MNAKVGHFGYNVPISVHAIGRGGHKCCVISNFILNIPFIVFFNIHGHVQLLRFFHGFLKKKKVLTNLYDNMCFKTFG
jgi:hypothetical protein